MPWHGGGGGAVVTTGATVVGGAGVVGGAVTGAAVVGASVTTGAGADVVGASVTTGGDAVVVGSTAIVPVGGGVWASTGGGAVGLVATGVVPTEFDVAWVLVFVVAAVVASGDAAVVSGARLDAVVLSTAGDVALATDAAAVFAVPCTRPLPARSPAADAAAASVVGVDGCVDGGVTGLPNSST